MLNVWPMKTASYPPSSQVFPTKFCGGWNARSSTVPKSRTCLSASIPSDWRLLCTKRDQDCLAGLDDGTSRVILKIVVWACANLGKAGSIVKVRRHRTSKYSGSLLKIFIFELYE